MPGDLGGDIGDPEPATRRLRQAGDIAQNQQVNNDNRPQKIYS
jgi:hypothetical protein